MSGRGEIEQRFQRLREISGIMTAMKSLSLVETRKLARFIGHQQRMLANIETAAADFLHFFPAQIAAKTEGTILLMVGSERGLRQFRRAHPRATGTAVEPAPAVGGGPPPGHSTRVPTC
jgi:hypothetical protein